MADLYPFARRLRREVTDAERLLWSKLRARRTLGLKFRRQVPIGPYIADFVCFERKLVIELDGCQHGAEPQRTRDAGRTKWLSEQGSRSCGSGTTRSFGRRRACWSAYARRAQVNSHPPLLHPPPRRGEEDGEPP